jgi:hypothetical protein
VNDSERLLIEHSCGRLVVQFHLYVNENRHLEIADLFADDAVWEQPQQGALAGRAAIASYLASKSTSALTQHVISNVLIDAKSADEAEGRCYFTHYHAIAGASLPARLEGPMSVGWYYDRFRRTPSGWRFSRRRAELRFVAERFEQMPLLAGGKTIGEAKPR